VINRIIDTQITSTSIPTSKTYQNHNWIAGAVVGPVVLFALIVFTAIWIRRTKMRKAAELVSAATEADEEKKADKPQLHSESKPWVELPSVRFNDTPIELPGVEVAPSELPVKEPVGTEMGGPEARVTSSESRGIL
jgi:hypothetical protein